MLDELFQDFRISVRGLLRTPLFAVTVILTLALGIGTKTADCGERQNRNRTRRGALTGEGAGQIPPWATFRY